MLLPLLSLNLLLLSLPTQVLSSLSYHLITEFKRKFIQANLLLGTSGLL